MRAIELFRGYYPDEIAKLLRVKHPAVSERLRLARSEARLYLDDPARLVFMSENPGAPIAKFDVDRTTDDLSSELRRAIFASRQGDCLTSKQLREIFDAKNVAGPDCKTLAHIVSCSIDPRP